jgi:peroxiredoxin
MFTRRHTSFTPDSEISKTPSRERGKTRKELIFVIVLLSVAALFAVYFLTSGSNEGKKIIKEGDRAPEFTLATPDQRSVSLSEHRGRVVLVHFWATWCPPCVEEMPRLEQLYREFFGNDLEVFAVNVDDGGAETVSSFLRQNRITIPVLLNPGGSVARRYGTYKFPETYVLDRSGTVRYKVIGPLDWMAPETTSALRRLVEER